MEIVFGIHAVQALLQRNAGRVERVLIQQDKVNARIRELVQLAQKSRVSVDQVDRDELERHADGNHQGVVAICRNQKSLNEGDLDELLERTSSAAGAAASAGFSAAAGAAAAGFAAAAGREVLSLRVSRDATAIIGETSVTASLVVTTKLRITASLNLKE